MLQTWLCCFNETKNIPRGEFLHSESRSATLEMIQDPGHVYSCDDRGMHRPGNSSYFYSPFSRPNIDPPIVQPSLFQGKSIAIVGGSTSRQMLEQFAWEGICLTAKSNCTVEYSKDRFLFNIEPSRYTNYKEMCTLDVRKLAKNVEQFLKRPNPVDYLIFNVATWWPARTIGYVIDTEGVKRKIHSRSPEWSYDTEHNSSNFDIHQNMSLAFVDMMERALHLMVRMKGPRTTLVWRSESFSDCTPFIGSSPRGIIQELITKKFINVDNRGVSILNISKATCDFVREFPHQKYDNVQLCFPSSALRNWIIEFQESFLRGSRS